MPKVFATVPGAEVWISHYGPATNDRPCLVPEAVAAELATVEGLRVEQDETPAPSPRLARQSRSVRGSDAEGAADAATGEKE